MDKRRQSLRPVVWGGMMTAVLVALGTTMNYMASGGTNAARLLNFVASGILGNAAFEGGGGVMLLGALLHVLVSAIWAYLFQLLYRRISFFSRDWRLSGVLYGIVIWAGMVFVVLPFSRTPPLEFDPASAAMDIVIIVLGAGMPISLAANKFRRRIR